MSLSWVLCGRFFGSPTPERQTSGLQATDSASHATGLQGKRTQPISPKHPEVLLRPEINQPEGRLNPVHRESLLSVKKATTGHYRSLLEPTLAIQDFYLYMLYTSSMRDENHLGLSPKFGDPRQRSQARDPQLGQFRRRAPFGVFFFSRREG